MKDGALPTRGVSSYRRLQKPEAWALRAYASFFVFTAEAALWERPARTNHASPGERRFLLGSGGYRRVARRGALWEGPAMHDSLKRKRA